jgi:hypothetical protein
MMQEGEDHRKLVEEKIRKAEAEAVASLSSIRCAVKDFLIHQKGYGEEDIEVDAEFPVSVDNCDMLVAVDYILTIQGRRFMIIKCSPGALESRERHLVAFARAADTSPIPFAAVTDGFRARILDASTGKAIAEGLNSLPEKLQAAEMVKTVAVRSYSPERMEKEKRILAAFESIKCTEESGE